jgi:hypothetical protein
LIFESSVHRTSGGQLDASVARRNYPLSRVVQEVRALLIRSSSSRSPRDEKEPTMSRSAFRFTALGAAVAACLASSSALGGEVSLDDVWISTGSTGGMMTGALSSARYSSDSTQTIGCEVTIAPGETTWAECFAYSTAGQYAACTTTNPGMIAGLGTLNDASSLFVEFDASGTCSKLGVTTGSFYMH